MNWYKIKIRPNDKAFSEYIRLRDRNLCQVNFKCFKGTQGTDCSHFQKRRKESVRYDPLNTELVCRKCHFFIENDPLGQRTYEEYKKKQLGEKEYKLLILRANTPGKRDDFLTKLYIQKLKQDLNENINHQQRTGNL
jgi:hypothetical protein